MLLKTLVNKVNGESDAPILPEGFVRSYVEAADAEPIQSRAGTFDGYIHVSSLSKDFCARQYAIAHHEGLPLFETVSGPMRVVWAQGRASEDHVKNAFIKKYGVHNIYARWTCTDHPAIKDHSAWGNKDHTYYQGMYKPNQTCKCGKTQNVHNEPHIYDHDFRVVGRPDLVFRYKGWLFCVEIKSIKGEGGSDKFVTFDDLEEPMREHLDQAMFYPDLLRKQEPELRVASLVTFYYISKSFKFKGGYKTYDINMDDLKYEKKRKELFDEAGGLKAYWDSKAGGELVLPPRICAAFNSPMAKKCGVNGRCFYHYEN